MLVKARNLLVCAILSTGFMAKAGDGRVRIGADGGFGTATVQVSGSTRTEAPGAISFLAEYSYTSTFTLGVEHFRTLVDDNGLSSGVGFSGAYVKYHFHNSRVMILPVDEVINEDEIVVRNMAPYIGLSAGVGQASLRALNEAQGDNRALSVGSYVGVKAGFEIPIWRMFAGYGEIDYAVTMGGTGTISFPRAVFGLLFAL